MGGCLDVAGPTSVNLILVVRQGSGWIVDVIRNGLLETVHSARRIPEDEFFATIQIAVHTSCTFRIACHQEGGPSVLTDVVVIRMRSGFAGDRQPECRRIRGLLQ